MRRRLIAAIIGSGCAAVLLAACGSGGSSSPTSTAPAAGSATPRASATAATTPTAAATEPVASPTPVPPTQAPAAQPTAVPPTQPPAVQPTKAPPPPPPPPATQSRTVVAANIAFDPKQLTASAGVPLTITLDNRDAGVQHDIIIYAPDGSQAAATSVITGPSTAATTFTPGAGNYRFKCSVHPQQMFGAISVQ